MNNMQQGGFQIGGQQPQPQGAGGMPWGNQPVAHPGQQQQQQYIPQGQPPAQFGAPQGQQPAGPVYQQQVQQPQPQQGFQAQMHQQGPANAMIPQNNPAQPGRMLTGAAAAAAMAAKPNGSNDEYSFSLKPGEMKTITFLDGDLDADGMFAVGFANEHVVRFGPKSFESFQCLQDYNQACPCCDQSRDVKNGPVGFQSLRGYFTVIDHDGYVSTKDNQRVQHTRRLYKTIQQLAILVQTLGQRDGHYSLKGRCFQVSRTGDKAAAVGDVLIPIDRYDVDGMLAQLRASYPDRADSFTLCDYSKVLTAIDAQQMYQMFQRVGGGGGNQPLGHSTGIGGNGLGFGQPQPQQANPGFGAPANPGFGAPAQPNFGAPAQPNFGAPAQPNYGAPAQQPFGGQPQQNQQPNFGAPAQQPQQQQWAMPQNQQQGYGALSPQNPQQPVFGAGLQPPQGAAQPNAGQHGYPDMSGQL